MNYKLLKEVLQILKDKLRCPCCRKEIPNKRIHVDHITEKTAFFRLECSRCDLKTLVEVMLIPKEHSLHSDRTHQGLQVKAKTLPRVSENDILDIKNFLKTFKGDFKEMFKS